MSTQRNRSRSSQPPPIQQATNVCNRNEAPTMKNGKRLTTLTMALALFAGLAALIFAAPAAAESPFTMYVTPEATTGTQTMTQWGYVPFEDNANSLDIEVRLVPTYSGCSTTHYTTISTTTFAAPNEKGWFTLCGVLWGSNVYNDVCAKKSECYVIAESTADFDVTATTGELKAQKEAKEAEEAEAKAAKEAQAKWEQEATEAKVAAEAKEAQERAARIEAENKAQEAQRNELEHDAAVTAQEEAARTVAEAAKEAAAKAAKEAKEAVEPCNHETDCAAPPLTEPFNPMRPVALTKASKLAKALKQCKKLKTHSKRVACEKQAKKRYKR
jgi:pyruvate/2-oxoglutarate dehydrogenase complex dihydrolipoamide acyltransferase (E2) component